MSRAFVKEHEDGEVGELPDRLISPHPNFVTRNGLALIEAELERADGVHVEAVATGDRTAIAAAARDLRYWTARRASAEVIEPPAEAREVHFGARVTIAREDGRRQTYRIVGEDEADPAQGTLSYVAPLARALMGKSVGDVVPLGAGQVEIVALSG